MQRIAVAVLVAASGFSAGCSGAPPQAPPGEARERDTSAIAYQRLAGRYESRVALCRSLPRMERRACRDQAEARFVTASQELEAMRLDSTPVIRLARAP